MKQATLALVFLFAIDAQAQQPGSNVSLRIQSTNSKLQEIAERRENPGTRFDNVYLIPGATRGKRHAKIITVAGLDSATNYLKKETTDSTVYRFNETGQLMERKWVGSIIKTIDKITWSYDNAGRLQKRIEGPDEYPAKEIIYRYEKGLPQELIVQFGDTVKVFYHFDKNGYRIAETGIRQNKDTGIVHRYTYSPSGQRLFYEEKSHYYRPALKEKAISYKYDKRGRIYEIRDTMIRRNDELGINGYNDTICSVLMLQYNDADIITAETTTGHTISWDRQYVAPKPVNPVDSRPVVQSLANNYRYYRKPLSVRDTVTYEYKYDDHNNPVEKKWIWGGKTNVRTFSYLYDDQGNWILLRQVLRSSPSDRILEVIKVTRVIDYY